MDILFVAVIAIAGIVIANSLINRFPKKLKLKYPDKVS